jgi:two-component system LytT family response regulator
MVDDEQSSLDLLNWLIGQYCPDISQMQQARSVADALPIINKWKPDIVFLDIQMPHQSGFELLNSIEEWNFEVIFTTAYNDYAIQAIRFSALDYLLKPIDGQELQKALERFKAKRIYAPAGQVLFRHFLQNLSSGSREKFKLALADVHDIKYVALDEIIRLQADSNYTHIYLKDKKPFVSAKTLKEYDEILEGHHFLRVHKSHLVNPQHITQYDRSGLLTLSDGSVVEVSRRKKEYVMEALRGSSKL